jgi:hypothetical protein
MAQVIVIHYGGVKVNGKYETLVFYEGLISALRKNGNNVMEIITNDFLNRAWNGSNELRPEIQSERLMGDILRFQPDLIISFNNSSIKGLEKSVDCPIAIWDADHFYHFNDLDELRANINRYIFFCSQKSDIFDCQAILGASRDQCYLMKPATSVISDESVEKKHVISFVGTAFGNSEEKKKLQQHEESYVALAKEILSQEESVENLAQKYAHIPEVEQTILDFGSVSARANTLAHVAPLGLNIHGGNGWLEVGLDSSLDIFCAYNPERVYSLKQTEDLYNASKIGLNINHAQAKSGYSWRVMDILASSAALVSNYSSDLEDELGKDLSKLIFYKTPMEAHEICSRLIRDENLRTEIVRRSNEIVRKYHTWEIRVSEMQDILGVNLVSIQRQQGEYILLDSRNYQSSYFEALSHLHSRGHILIRIVRFMLPYGVVKIMKQENVRSNVRRVKEYLMESVCFVLPYGLAKFVLNKANWNLLHRQILDIFCTGIPKRELISIRLIRFLLPYGFVRIVRWMKR